MRADGVEGVALCRPCHDDFMEAWRVEDAAREFAEHHDDFREFQARAA